MLAVTESSGIWFAVLLLLAPLYLTYKVYRTGVESEAKQGAILEAANDAIITMDAQLAIREFNPAAEQMFGYRRTDILGRNVEILLPPTERAVAIGAMSQYLATGRGPLAGRSSSSPAVRADGTEFPVELTVALVGCERESRDDRVRPRHHGAPSARRAAAAVAEARSDRAARQRRRARLQQHPDEHHGIRGSDPDGREGQRRAAAPRRPKSSCRSSAAPASRVSCWRSAGGRRPGRSMFDLGDVVGGMETMLRRLIGPEIDFRIVRHASPTVRADPAQIEQVILNLVINARDAMPEGGRLTVTVDEVDLDEWAAAMLGETQAGHYARLSVTDTGTGMDEQTRAKLFEPFFTTKEQGKGTGLGLSIVYGIVKQSGGHITVTSEPGQGATFLIYLPVAAAVEPAAVS